jgi:hypothetical protein
MYQVTVDDVAGTSTPAALTIEHQRSLPTTPQMTAPDTDANGGDDVPRHGMVFRFVADAKAFYNNYACWIGFETMVRDSRLNAQGITSYDKLTCARNGTPHTKCGSSKSTRSKKIKCLVKLCIHLLDDSLWGVTHREIKLDHVYQEQKHQLASTKNGKRQRFNRCSVEQDDSFSY